jgi:hypothetical protein
MYIRFWADKSHWKGDPGIDGIDRRTILKWTLKEKWGVTV